MAVPFFMVFTLHDSLATRLLALFVFVIAGLTDLADGYLARKNNMVTALGVFLDPLADKLIITAAFIAFVDIPFLKIPSWMVVAIVGREFLITGLRTVAASRGVIVAADDGGKFKTAVQNTAIIIVLTELVVLSTWERVGITPDTLRVAGGWKEVCVDTLTRLPYGLVWVATVVSVWTGVNYVWKHRQLLKDAA